jgi:hypothetical protein
MTTTKKPPDTLTGSLRQQQKWIDEMRGSARMRARLMRKIPKPVEFPRGSGVTNTGPPGQRFALVGAAAAAMGMRPDANAPEEPLSPLADKENRV